MNWLIIFEVIVLLLVLVMVITLWYGRYGKNKWDSYDKPFATSILVAFIIIAIAFAMIVPWFTYCDAIELSANYTCACDTIKETEELLMKYEDLDGEFGNIGSGLESMELKAELKDAIQTRNDYKSDILSWLNNPFNPFKDVLRRGLPSNF